MQNRETNKLDHKNTTESGWYPEKKRQTAKTPHQVLYGSLDSR